MSTHRSDIPALKATALITTLTAATIHSATSLLFVPALIKPLADRTVPSSPKKSSSTLSIPQTPTLEGRLTPQPFGTFDFSTGSSQTYKAIARQFSAVSRALTTTTLPLSLFSLSIFAISAYRARPSHGLSPHYTMLWRQYAACATLIGATFPITSIFMTPLVTKIRRIAGEEEKIEPYEDAPIDFEAEKTNTLTFVGEWSLLNLARGVVLSAAGLLGAVALWDE